MNILVIFTGGTIGSSLKGEYIVPDDASQSRLICMYQEKYKEHEEEISFDIDTPYTILSENLNGAYITKLTKCINLHLKMKYYDGIIVTHGTDTLQYTAAALGMIFQKADIPIVLVSSNYPLEDIKSNGLYNFAGAVDYIRQHGGTGVFVSYKNENEDVKIMNPLFVKRHEIYSDEIRNLESINPISIDINPGKVNLEEISPVKIIVPYPGMTYELPEENIKTILFTSYHSGTMQTASEELRVFCNQMKERGIPMYVCGVPDGAAYESTKYYEELGIKVLSYGTDVYWYMRLWIGGNP